MKEDNPKKISLVLVLMLILLMISFVFVQIRVFDFFETKVDTSKAIEKDSRDWGVIEDIKAAKGMYRPLKEKTNPPHFIDHQVKKRTLKSFYSLRAYSGAPPMIPHELLGEHSLTGDSCLGCHRNGGYTPKFKAYAPVVPHPEKLNCRQCHNPMNDKNLFKKTTWVKNPGERGFAHLPGSPLVIPHSVQMRENCLSCHSGPAAVVEIRTTHPERINCMQCHVEKKASKIWRQK